ncbi:conjugal transfer protein TrbP (plasmid) [Variovorax sp. SRS16]|uniref:TraX family protein n=1 Tax=Variovorax sp. SRS16 TaxID=282217 RepID=UPI001316F817|nr:TraX family protein [Variovorax sp. SRS16]VTU46193.1 conjugal transfer protein TrbP [Variovorax sp. SRS16]
MNSASAQLQAAASPATAVPRLHVADGTLEAIKWLALVLMTGDHVNKYLFNETLPYLFELGRLAAPLFAFVLAYNLARPGAMTRGAYQRTMRRLAVVGLLATPAFLALGGLLGGTYPLNIMFMLLASTAAMYLLERGEHAAALTVIVIGGALVEFWWPAIGFAIAVWSFARSSTWRDLIFAFACCALLWVINRNFWALAALPLLGVLSRIDLAIPRVWWIFYAFYPAHLVALWLIRIPMAKAGYLFF